MNFPKPPLTTADVCKVLDRSARRVQQLADAGVLAVVRTSHGQRLFDPDQVEAVRQQRAQRRAPKDV